MNKVSMAAFASPIHEAGGLKIGYQFTDLRRHACASSTKFA